MAKRKTPVVKVAKKRSKRSRSSTVRGANFEKKNRFSFSALKKKDQIISSDTKNDDVVALQSYLTHAGYLGKIRTPGTMCKETCKALRHFQKCYGFKDTGAGDAETLKLIQRPRCGVADIPTNSISGSGPAPFVLSGCKYDQGNLTYAFLNFTPDLPQSRQREIIAQAFDSWSSVSSLSFAEVGVNDSPDFPVSWEQGRHGDDAPFDGPGTMQGNTLAHAFFPPPCGGLMSGAVHFDDAERWVDQAEPNGIRLLNVAIHEIGHLLGLGHSNNENAIMFAFYSDEVDHLKQDDIAGIQAMYDPPTTQSMSVKGRLNATADSNSHHFSVLPGPVVVELTGPDDKDFDLYVSALSQPGRNNFQARGFSAGSQEMINLLSAGNDLFVTVDSWRGAGEYTLQVRAG